METAYRPLVDRDEGGLTSRHPSSRARSSLLSLSPTSHEDSSPPPPPPRSTTSSPLTSIMVVPQGVPSASSTSSSTRPPLPVSLPTTDRQPALQPTSVSLLPATSSSTSSSPPTSTATSHGPGLITLPPAPSASAGDLVPSHAVHQPKSQYPSPPAHSRSSSTSPVRSPSPSTTTSPPSSSTSPPPPPPHSNVPLFRPPPIAYIPPPSPSTSTSISFLDSLRGHHMVSFSNLWSDVKRPQDEKTEADEEGEGVSPLLQRLLASRAAIQGDAGSAHVNPDFASLPLASTPLASPSDGPKPPPLRFLTFTDPATEAAYNLDYFTRYFHTLRHTVLICVTIWSLFVINDIYQNAHKHRAKVGVTVGLRFVVAGVVALSTLSSYHPQVRAMIGTSVLRWTIFYYILLFGTCQVVFGVVEADTPDPTYCDFIILISSMSASFFRLPFFMSTACNLLLCLVFVLLTMGTSAWSEVNASAAATEGGCVVEDRDGLVDFLSATVWIFIALWLFTFNGYLVEFSMRSTFLAAKQLREEQEKNQRVLALMLPVRVISDLRDARGFVYEHHDTVTVLFSHIHEFDAHTATLEPKAVVELLNSLFSRFDHLTDCFGVYKVETIGDVYLVSGGVPDAMQKHASIVALLSLAMMEEMTKLSTSLAQTDPQLGQRTLQLRIGIHSGSVIAGVVGMKYPRYRLMGDTVNTASRMSTTCSANDIQLSKATFERLGPEFVCRYHGPTFIKGKGLMDTYLLHSVLPPDGPPGAIALPVGIEEAIGLKTGQEVARELGLPIPPNPTQPPVHHRVVSQPNMPRTYSPPLPRRPSASLPATPTAPLAPRQSSAPVSRGDPSNPEQVPSYHAHPERDRLYSNVLLSTPVYVVADDAAAIDRLIAARLPVHQLRRTFDADEKAQVASPGRETYVQDIEGRRLSRGEPMRAVDEGKDAETHSESDLSPAPSVTLDLPSTQPPRARSEPPPAPSMGDSGARAPPPLTPSPSPYQVPPFDGVASSDVTVTIHIPPASHLSPSAPPSAPVSPHSSHSDRSPIAPSPSTVYTLSAQAVRGAFLAPVAQPSILRRFERTDGAAPATTLPAKVRLSNFLHHPREFLRILITGIRSVVILAFVDDEALEKKFQQHWVNKSLKVSRLGFSGFSVGLLLLGLWGAFNPFAPDQREDPGETWPWRGPAMLIGVCVVLVSYVYPRWFCAWHQPIVAISWTVMTVLQIVIATVLHANTLVYGVSGTLILLTSTAFFVGLQFKWVGFTTLCILLIYVVAGIITSNTQPQCDTDSSNGSGTEDSPSGGSSTYLNSFFLLAAVVLSMMSAHSSEYFARLDFIRYLTLDEEERKTREIRDNMLPKQVMDDVMAQQTAPGTTPSIIAHECERASVMFCDIVSFTALASKITAEDVVAILNVMFSTFDALTTKHGVYKVETIGDAYLACSGVVDRRADHTRSLVRCALDFQTSSHYLHSPDDKPLKVRIGIHTGTVVAGVVGRKMPRYHLFGATVTIAEEMEQSGVAGGVVISGETHVHVQSDFECRQLSDLPKTPPVQRWEVLHAHGLPLELKAANGDEMEEPRPAAEIEEEKTLPPVVSQILVKVAEANLHDFHERRDRGRGVGRWGQRHINGGHSHEANGGRFEAAATLREEKAGRGEGGGGRRRRAISDTTSPSAALPGAAQSAQSGYLTPLLGAAAEPSSPPTDAYSSAPATSASFASSLTVPTTAGRRSVAGEGRARPARVVV